MLDLPFEVLEDYALIFIQRSQWEFKQQALYLENSNFHESIESHNLLGRLINLNHPFLKWAQRQAPYLKGIKKFSKKK